MDVKNLLRKEEDYYNGIEIIPPVALAVMHPHKRRKEERRLAAIEKRLSRKRYTRKPGHVHPKKKKATRRRLMEKRWRDNPFGCVILGYGSHAIDREAWDKLLQPYWSLYDPKLLRVVKRKRDPFGVYYGTKEKPYTIHSLVLKHK